MFFGVPFYLHYSMKYKVNFIDAQNTQGLGNVGETGVAMWYESKAPVLSTALYQL